MCESRYNDTSSAYAVPQMWQVANGLISIQYRACSVQVPMRAMVEGHGLGPYPTV